MHKHPTTEDLGPLILGFLDDALSAGQLRQLEAQLESDPAARDLLVHICTQASVINEKLADSLQVREQASTPTLSSTLRLSSSPSLSLHPELRPRGAEGRPEGRRSRSVWYFAAALLALAATAWFIFSPSPQPPSSSPDATRSVALLTRTAGAVFTESAAPMDLGVELPPGVIELQSGTAELMFGRGAMVTLIGPCAFRIVDDNRGHLQRGTLAATVPRQAVGFTVDGPRGVSVVDLGTEFRMAVDDRRRTEVYVVSGRVRMTLPGDGGQAASLELGEQVAGVFDPTASTRAMRTIDAQTFLRSWWRRTGADQIVASSLNAALLDTDADGLGDGTFVPRRGSVAVGEQNNKFDRHPLRYCIPFDLTDEQRDAIASARRVELVLTLDHSQHVDDLSMQLAGLPGHPPAAASPEDYHAPAQVLIDAAMDAGTQPGPVRLDVTDFARRQVRAGGDVVFRCQAAGVSLPHIDRKINNFIVNTVGHPDPDKTPKLILHW